MYFIYILASNRNGTLYVGSTSDLIKRMWEHKEKLTEGFTQKYDVTRLVYFEKIEAPNEMVKRERQLKAWERKWKIALIEKNNPDWKDLYEELLK